MEAITLLFLLIVMLFQFGSSQKQRAYAREWERQWRTLHRRLDDIEARLPPPEK